MTLHRTAVAAVCLGLLLGGTALAKPKKAKKSAKKPAAEQTASPKATEAKPADATPAGQKAGSEAAKPAVPGPGAARTAEEVAMGVSDFYAKHPALQARFKQVVSKQGLKASLTRDGVAYLKRGDPAKDQQGQMRWDYPNEEIFYFCDGVILWSYEKRERLAVRIPVKNSQLYQATTYLMGQGDLAKDFKLELMPSTLAETWALKLTPRQGTQVMRSLTLVVDKQTYAVKASKLVDPVGDTTDLLWLQTEYKPLEDSTFQWTPPAGVTVKDLAKQAQGSSKP